MLLAIECGYRYRFFGDDAVAAAQCLGFASWRDHNFMVISFLSHLGGTFLFN